MDIVEWLRGKPMVVNENGYTGISVAGGTLLNKAADEIERLRETLQSIKKIPNSEAAYGIVQTFVDAALKDKE